MPTPDKNEKSFSADEVKALIAETTRSIFEQFAPVLESVALTPAKLREANKPYVDPLVIARQNHERREFHVQQAEQEATIKMMQDNCPHVDSNNQYTISLQRNFHDNMPRGICVRCHIYIEPMRWDSRPETQPDGEIIHKSFVKPEHRLYHLVRLIESRG